MLKQVLKNAPETKPGTKYEYSNVGYGLATAMAERVAKDSWENLMREGLFKPLEMTSAGFGAPGRKGKVEQPWGHSLENNELKASQVDNAPVLGPAGTVHCSLPDWAKFVALHVQGERGKGRLLKAETFRSLHAPPKGQEYAFGWVSVFRDWAGGQALMHGGSNTMWYAAVWIAPQRNFAVLAATNRGGKEGTRACDDASAALIEHFEKHFAKQP
jgi:CubicO group peptidase (beta-lactamase class C family)